MDAAPVVVTNKRKKAAHIVIGVTMALSTTLYFNACFYNSVDTPEQSKDQ